MLCDTVNGCRIPRLLFKGGMMSRRVVPIPEICMACGLCQVNCVVAHSKTKDVVKAYKEESAKRPSARNRLERRGALSFALTCRHCEEPICVYSCLTGAMQKDPDTGLVSVDSDKCVGCWTCVMVCPFSAVAPDTDAKKVFKCDLCKDLEVPACVAECPNHALVVVEYEEDEMGDLAVTVVAEATSTSMGEREQ